jgi:type I restriction enzyme, S subunit
MSWPEVPLNELGYVSRGKSRHRPRNDAALYDGEFPFIQTAEVKAANLRITGHTQTYSEKGLAQSRMWPANTLCITIAANIADTALLGYPACFPDSIIGFIADEKKCDVRFVKYFFNTVQERMRMVSQGATQDNLSQGKLLRFGIPCPPLAVQKAIGDRLSAYDDLIEANRRRIALLEESARLLYREWFVDLRFPGADAAAFVDGLPMGWLAGRLGDVIQFQKGKKPLKIEHEQGDGEIPHLLMDVMRGKDISEFTNPNGMVVTLKHDSLMVMDGSGSGETFIGHCGALGSTMGRYRITEGSLLSPYWLYLTFQERIDELKTGVNGSAIPHANKDQIKSMLILIPPASVSDSFTQKIAPTFDLIQALKNQITNLTQARDALLPRLMSGAIRV